MLANWREESSNSISAISLLRGPRAATSHVLFATDRRSNGSRIRRLFVYKVPHEKPLIRQPLLGQRGVPIGRSCIGGISNSFEPVFPILAQRHCSWPGIGPSRPFALEDGVRSNF
jgi:hypothetical protein